MKFNSLSGLVAALVLSACGPVAQQAAGNTANESPEQVARQGPPALELSAEPISANEVRFTVRAVNVPLPIEVMAEVSLAGQADQDVWIGNNRRVRLDQETTTFTVNASRQDHPLPRGEYVADVQFYPRWGAAGNSAAANLPELRAEDRVDLRGAGGSRADAELRNERRRWVMGTLGMNEPWDERAFVARLGEYQKYPSDLSHLHDAYYFPGADVTLLVNRLRQEVTVWRLGRATR